MAKCIINININNFYLNLKKNNDKIKLKNIKL